MRPYLIAACRARRGRQLCGTLWARRNPPRAAGAAAGAVMPGALRRSALLRRSHTLAGRGRLCNLHSESVTGLRQPPRLGL